ncbi:alpha/beta hydrolase [Phyllobacterium sp. SB3]|uniref:alpha/beta hydrolase n=1 Tax=Phyllobacterium sp. SB3 TaxID=3156073 RepID=UPI0032AFE655
MTDERKADASSIPATDPSLYDTGSTTIFASRHDPRFSYCLYVPPGLGKTDEQTQLVVAMHGTGRSFITYRDAFAAFGRWNNCIILAPLFPVGVEGDRNASGFKYIIENDLRYDELLIAIVDEVKDYYRLKIDRFAMFGYSGGGHFTHRFLLLHPDRLWAASIGAPGSVTLLDPTRDWWVGTRDFAKLFGKQVDIEALSKVAVQMVVGAADLETWEITHKPGGRYWMPDANRAGKTRPERLASLRDSFEAAGIGVRFDLVPNMAHDGPQAVPVAEDFFAMALARYRSSIPQKE